MKGYTRIVAEKFATMSAQLVSLADVYDALINEKCYKAAYSREEAFHKKRGCEKRIVPKKKKDQEFIMNSRSFFLL